MAERLGVALGERRGRGRRGRRWLGPAGGAEDPGHLGEPPRPAAPGCERELALDHAREDRLLPLGLDLVGDHKAALARLLYLERVALDRLRVEEPARHLGEREQLCRAAGGDRRAGGRAREIGREASREQTANHTNVTSTAQLHQRYADCDRSEQSTRLD